MAAIAGGAVVSLAVWDLARRLRGIRTQRRPGDDDSTEHHGSACHHRRSSSTTATTVAAEAGRALKIGVVVPQTGGLPVRGAANWSTTAWAPPSRTASSAATETA
jgi:hypothetical protein